MRVLVCRKCGKLIQRMWQDDDGNRRSSVEIQVTHVGPDLQFAIAQVTKAQAVDWGPASDGPSAASSAEEK
jgi:single-strand DNA-binding protein